MRKDVKREPNDKERIGFEETNIPPAIHSYRHFYASKNLSGWHSEKYLPGFPKLLLVNSNALRNV